MKLELRVIRMVGCHLMVCLAVLQIERWVAMEDCIPDVLQSKTSSIISSFSCAGWYTSPIFRSVENHCFQKACAKYG